MSDESPKIFIDEDWKSQVQREREETLKQAAAPEGVPAQAPGQPEEAPGNPFLMLVSSLATQTMFAFGMVAEPDQQEIYVDIDQARYLIEMLIALRDKTKGNLTPEEQGELTGTVADLQRIYVALAQQIQETALRNAGVTPMKKPDAR